MTPYHRRFEVPGPVIRILACFLFLLGGCLPGRLVAQRPILDDFLLFETADQVKVYGVAQDERGFLWLGTSRGLFYFNGQGDLTTIAEAVRLPATAVALSGRRAYVGYSDGRLGWVEHDSLHFYVLAGDRPGTAIHALYKTPSDLLAATDGGLYAISEGRSELLKADGLPRHIHSIRPGPGNSLLLGSSTGLYQLDFGQKRATVRSYALFRDSLVTALRPVAGDGSFWLSTGQGGIARITFRGNDFSTLCYSGPWPWGPVGDIAVLSADHAWAGTGDGYLLEITVRDSISVKAHHYPEKSLNSLVYMKSGSVWAGTNTGLSAFSTGFARSLRIGPPYSLTNLTATACDNSNNLWFAELNELYTVSLDHPGTPRRVGSLPAIITCLYTSGKGELWIGTLGGGLWRCSGRGRPAPVRLSGLRADTLFSIAGSGDHLWLAGAGGVDECALLPGGLQLSRHYAASELGTDRVFCLFRDSRDRMWIGTDGAGLCCYDRGRYYHHDSASGIQSDAVCTVTEDSYGNIWAGTPGQGVSRFDGKTWQHFDHRNGLQNLNIATVCANASGQVVIVNDAGVDEWFPASRQFRHYNYKTSPSIDSVSYVLNSCVRDSSGNVCLPGLEGLLVFSRVQEPLELRPAVHISGLSVFQRSADFGKSRFAYNENNISFHFRGANFSDFERLHYRYRLEGYNEEWVKVSNEEPVNFPRLPAGSYTFRIQASLDDDFEDAAEDKYAFVVVAPLWKRSWFIALCCLALGAAVVLYVKRRERRLRYLASLKQERTQFEYELFKSQVNPHFLFNSLNILTNLIEEDHDRAIEYTVQLSSLYRNILAYHNQSTIPLSEECRLLQAYLHIQQRRFGSALQLRMDIPQAALAGGRTIPLALQLLVENAIKHNSVSAATPLLIDISVFGNEELTVRNLIRPRLSDGPGAGMGLKNISNRYSLLTKKPVRYGREGGDFVVRLPLL